MLVLAGLSIIGITVIQIYWFRRAFDLEDQRFNREVNAALMHVANQFTLLDSTRLPDHPIRQLSSNYFAVMVNSEIDANLLEYLLKSEFEKRELRADFEYGIYDCTSDRMVYGNFISFSNDQAPPTAALPKWENQPYYFGVNFPQRASTLINRMGIWTFSSFVLFVVIVFFSYALWVISRQKRLSEIQKDFINNMTHEFKTPISTIAISTGELKNEHILTQPDRLRNYISIIENENNRMKNQVERVLQIATMDNSIQIKNEEIHLKRLIQEVIQNMSPSIEARRANIQVEISNDPIVKGDELHLSNVFFNLLDNGIKYCEKVPDIIISVKQERETVNIQIQDNGIGIPKKLQKNIFMRFFRVPTGNIHNVKGFGLGLSYVKQVIEALGGKISVKKSDDFGSTFLINLPTYHGRK